MENNELQSQPVRGVKIGREERVYGLTLLGGKKDYQFEPASGIELKDIDIIGTHPIQLVAKWTAKGIGYKQMPAGVPLLELAHAGSLSVQFYAFSEATINTLARKVREKKSHPGQQDLGAAMESGGDEQPAPKRGRGRPKKTEESEEGEAEA